MSRALNVGVAEANMICIGEACAAMGYNTWVSTFCPFFDWKVLRRIAIGYQERIETIQMKDGWLSDGHGLDLTFLATAPNFETKTNGATHMGNDDTLVFDGIAHLKIIDISCPNQLIAAMKWVMEGNKGLVYMRIMRAPSGVIYDHDLQFEFGKGYILKDSLDHRAVIVSSGRGVHEALAAAKELEQSRVATNVVDMPSIDERLLLDLYDSGKLIIVAEQNNGYIWSWYRKVLFKSKETIDTARIIPVNTLDNTGRPQFIHSATYSQLLNRFGLAPNQLAATIKRGTNSI
jgi:transketolase C-terminal domain/subunit